MEKPILKKIMEKATLKNLMEELALPTYCITDFTKNGKIYCSTSSGIKNLTPFVENAVDEAIRIHGKSHTVYHVIVSHLYGCKIVDCLLYPKNTSEAHELLNQAKKGYILSYCKNIDIPMYSEAGDIYVKFNSETNSLKRY